MALQPADPHITPDKDRDTYNVPPADLACQSLLDPDHGHILLVYTAVPGTESHEKLRLLSVIGPQPLR